MFPLSTLPPDFSSPSHRHFSCGGMVRPVALPGYKDLSTVGFANIVSSFRCYGDAPQVWENRIDILMAWIHRIVVWVDLSQLSVVSKYTAENAFLYLFASWHWLLVFGLCKMYLRFFDSSVIFSCNRSAILSDIPLFAEIRLKTLKYGPN